MGEGSPEPTAKAKAVAAEVVTAVGNASVLKATFPRRPIHPGGYCSDAAWAKSAAAARAADVRQDLGMPVDLRVPVGYRNQVAICLEWFDTDPLFSMLIRRFWEFGNTRADWIVGSEDDEPDEDRDAQSKKDQDFFNYWASMINIDVNHTLPGLDPLNIQIMKTCLLAGMSPAHWRWGVIEFQDEEYYAPIEMRIEQPLSVHIAPGKTHGDWSAFIKIDSSTKREQTEPGGGRGGDAAQLRKSPSWKELRPSNAFVLRFEHTQIDTRENRTGGQVFTAANVAGTDDQNAGFPTVPYIQLMEAIQLRRGLAASDMRIIDGIINFLLLWRVGNGDVGENGKPLYPVRPTTYNTDGTLKKKGTVDEFKDYLSNAEKMDVMEMVLPYWADLEIKMPDVQALLSSDKYWHATSEILHRFGVFLGEDASNVVIGEMNVLAFEAQIFNLRETHVARFWEMIAKKIMLHKRNKNLFGNVFPNYHWRALGSRTAEYRKEIINGAKLGAFSHETVARAFGVSPQAELRRIRRENNTGATEDIAVHVPVAFSQQTVNPGGDTKTVDDASPQRGRPAEPPGERESGVGGD